MADTDGTADGRLLIDLDALCGNFRSIAARVSPARCAAVIKADGYGLGAARVEEALGEAGCRDFFTATLAEAIAVRSHVPDQARLFVLNGIPAGAEGRCADHGIVPVLNTTAQALRWAGHAHGRGERLDAVLQFDSGMSRLGLSLSDAARIAQDGDFAASVRPVLLMSHLACADLSAHPANLAQHAAFEAAAAWFPGVERSLANSGGAFLPPAFHQHLVRLGIGVYGGVASDAADFGVRPVVSIAARILQIRDVEGGTAVGYGLTHVADAPARWATVGVGYADGWPRSLGNVGSVWFRGQRLPIIGRVSMDSMSVDISSLGAGDVGEGDWVELVGPDQTLDSVAAQAGTISYELLTGLGHRFDRTYRHASVPAQEVAS